MTAARTVTKVPLSRVAIDEEVKQRVLAAVESGQYILGPECRAFEAELAAWLGRAHCVLVSSATSALLLTMQARGIGAGDEVLVPAHTAFPTIEAIFLAGATPVFVDIDDSGTLDPAWLEPRVTARTKAILPVHLYGHPCDLDAIGDVATRHGLDVIEDCAQAHGARFRERMVGTFGVAGVLSFYPSKNLTVLGDGGAVLTDDAGLAKRLRMLRDHGRQDKHTHELVGWNLRFNELQAAAGRVLLRRLDAMNEARRAVAARYHALLAGLPLALPVESKLAHHVYHLYVVRTEAPLQRDALAKHLEAAGVQTGIHYPVPNHLQPATSSRPRVRAEALPNTEAWAQRILSLPMFPGMTLTEIEYVAASVREFFAGRA
jgi:dTDP-4-amino-4,6-dideoxygalactose transaminase